MSLKYFKESKNIYTKLEDVLNPKKMTKKELNEFPISIKKEVKNVKQVEDKESKSSNEMRKIKEKKLEIAFINAFKQSN